MKITAVTTRVEHLALARPYTIAFRTVTDVTNFFVEIHTDRGAVGRGCGAPEAFVTGESVDDCRTALDEGALGWLRGREIYETVALCRELSARLPHTPAARAALDMALYDLLAQQAGCPLADLLGRAHTVLPTSITIGIKPVDETVAEGREYVDRGFKILKVKLGHDLEEDLERLARLRETLGKHILMRVDPNQGYDARQTQDFAVRSEPLGIEFIEQPMPVADTETLRTFSAELRSRIAADECLLGPEDALRLAAPPAACGIFNIKLMKCGGLKPALHIAAIAEAAGLKLMWGCMDESIISISAALHGAFASPATRYLDLDGSLDLARDVVDGGFALKDGMMSPTGAPGLGVRPLD